jgi:flagellar biosynthesis/type III secretory pathway chaperone
MKLSPEQQHQLIDLLRLELTQADQLQQILEREFQALGAKDPDLINEISRNKLAQMRQLEQQLQQRGRFLATLGIQPSKEGVDRLIHDLPGGDPLAGLWRRLLETGTRLQRQNEINGSLVTQAQRHTKRALDILCGRLDLPSTYGPEGEARTGITPNSLAKA